MLKRKGFTLAEVLVTLMVIGVVAALTIPQLIQSTAKNEYKAGLKKSLGALNQALALNVAQNAQEANDSSIANAVQLADYFGRRMVVIKGSGTADFFTADGTQYTFVRGAACGTADVTASAGVCTVLVDVNGERAPNQMSTGTTPATYDFKDRYYFVIRNNAVLPSTGGTANFGEAAAVGAITEQ
jgi:prepilin-type N-terminal cleavage/methylation domain-containing protein